MAGKEPQHEVAAKLEEGELPTSNQAEIPPKGGHDGTITLLPEPTAIGSTLEEGEIRGVAVATETSHDGTPSAKRAATLPSSSAAAPHRPAASTSPSKAPTSQASTLASASHQPDHGLNPPVSILAARTHNRPDPITVYVIRDDVLPGGTKQRATALLFNSQDRTYVYAGPVFGYAQLALTVCANASGKHATVIVARQRSGELHPLTARAAALGAHVVERGYPNRLKDIQAFSQDYVGARPRTYLLPFGLDCETFIQGLVDRLRVSLPAHLLTRPPRRLWLVAGSATLLASFSRLWPHTEFLVVQVGKTVWPDQIGWVARLDVTNHDKA